MAGSPNFPKLRGEPLVSRMQDSVATQLGPVARAVSSTPMLDGTLPQWVNFSLLAASGFANNTTSPLLAPASYYVDPFFRFWMQGALVNAAGCAANTQFATLALGLRPRYQQRAIVKGTGGTFQSVLIDPSGAVSVEVAVAAGGFVDLCGGFLVDG